MSLKFSNGSELFSRRDLDRLRTAASGRMGSRSWVGTGALAREVCGASSQDACREGECTCSGACAYCLCATKRPRQS